jgi:4-aminobutyrate aminotransferase-like enzyme
VGSHFHTGLQAMKEKHTIIGDVRGMGLMQGIELVKDRKTKEPGTDLTNQLLERLRVHGLLVGKGGMYGNVVRMSPPLNISKADVDIALATLDKGLSEVTAK